jgi:hypothetical protein
MQHREATWWMMVAYAQRVPARTVLSMTSRTVNTFRPLRCTTALAAASTCLVAEWIHAYKLIATRHVQTLAAQLRSSRSWRRRSLDCGLRTRRRVQYRRPYPQASQGR